MVKLGRQSFSTILDLMKSASHLLQTWQCHSNLTSCYSSFHTLHHFNLRHSNVFIFSASFHVTLDSPACRTLRCISTSVFHIDSKVFIQRHGHGSDELRFFFHSIYRPRQFAILSRLSLPNTFTMSPASLPIFILLVSGIPCLIRPAAAGCELKNCGRLANISQPFWLRDLQQPGICGSPAFELTCEDNLPVLVNVNYPFLHIQDIFYQNKSFLVNNSYFSAGDCQIPHHNLSLNHPDRFRVSSANRELFFFRNCTAPPSNVAKMVQCAGNGTFAYLGGRYGVAEPLISSSACNKSIMVPVLLHERDEKGGSLLGSSSKNGFLVEYEYDGVDYCLECRESGGECSHRDKFKCICRDGRSELRRCSMFTDTTTNTLLPLFLK
ncbi:hypothetical protein Cni_G11547 [Canna indica]|uniref:Wall-associated receptor kinase galacturonan-binding domain-containing protein n=1 Tax=Canna indica TaxID=4628 RepID=A0AAQ3K8Z1_9LILI|nr:hypothetical protein Cni_G11547 [Canna indica]